MATLEKPKVKVRNATNINNSANIKCIHVLESKEEIN